MQDARDLSAIPSVDLLLRSGRALELVDAHGRAPVVDAIRLVLAELRKGPEAGDVGVPAIMRRVTQLVEQWIAPSLRPVFNMTGTVLHTNLGRAPLPPEAIAAVAAVAAGASNLEYDLDGGKRGDRDDHLEEFLCRLTGAQAATVVNNNAAAVMLLLNSLANRREVVISRGELIEIGGSFRLPDVMSRSGCRLREVGATNRTHLHDFDAAIGPRTGLVMKAHTSNYEIRGFTKSVDEADLARLCRERGVPFAVDLGSGTLLDLSLFGLPHEPTVGETIACGADIVTFSGDKLLGGPQAGVIVGRADLIARIKRNPMKRALRVDKMTIAALAAVLQLYVDTDRLVARLPTLRLLVRTAEEIRRLAERLCPCVQAVLESLASVETVDCVSQIGSGALPTREVRSAGLAIRPLGAKSRGTILTGIESAFRALPVPVIGRIQDGAFLLDMRCLEDEAGFLAQLGRLSLPGRRAP